MMTTFITRDYKRINKDLKKLCFIIVTHLYQEVREILMNKYDNYFDDIFNIFWLDRKYSKRWLIHISYHLSIRSLLLK